MVGPVRREPRFVYLSDRYPEDASAQEARYGWRLVAANNRPLGRGPAAETSLEHCRAQAAELHRALTADPDRVPAVILLDTVRGVWSWRVSLDGAPAAVAVHPYLRRVECARGLAQFVASASAADPADGVVRHFGPQSLRGYHAGQDSTSSSLGATW